MTTTEKILEKVSGAKLDMIKGLGKTISESAKPAMESVKEYGKVLSGSKAKKSLEALKKNRSAKDKGMYLATAKADKQLTKDTRKKALTIAGAMGIGGAGVGILKD